MPINSAVFLVAEAVVILLLYTAGTLLALRWLKKRPQSLHMVPDELLGIACPGVGVGVAIVGNGTHPELGDVPDRKIRFLMMLRGKDVRNEPNCWDFPGGGVALNETLQDVARRESHEELGIELGEIRQIGAIEHLTEPTPGKPSQHWVSITHAATLSPGSNPRIMEPHKCSELRWMTLEEIEALNNVTSTMPPNIRLIRERYPEL